MSRLFLCLILSAVLFFFCPWKAMGAETDRAEIGEDKTHQEEIYEEEELADRAFSELDFSSVDEFLGKSRQGDVYKRQNQLRGMADVYFFHR